MTAKLTSNFPQDTTAKGDFHVNFKEHGCKSRETRPSHAGGDRGCQRQNCGGLMPLIQPQNLCMALVVLFLMPASASAGDGDVPLQQSLTPGMRVRILAPDLSPSKLIGTVHQVSDNSVSLDVPGHNEPVSILREKIARLDVSEGPRSRGVDSAIGGVIGAGIGAAGCAAGNGSGQGHIVSTGAVAGVCALLGGGLGALIGAVIPPGEHWKEITAARYRFSFAPRLDHGADVALAWKF
jgi:hypothetical protein